MVAMSSEHKLHQSLHLPVEEMVFMHCTFFLMHYIADQQIEQVHIEEKTYMHSNIVQLADQLRR